MSSYTAHEVRLTVSPTSGNLEIWVLYMGIFKCITMSSSSKTVYLASVSDSLKLWGSEDSAPADIVAKNYYKSTTDTNFHSIAWNHTNQVVAIGGSEPKVHLVQINNGQLLSSLVLSESKLSHLQVKAVAFSHNSRYLACSLGSPVQLWDLKRRQIKAVFTGHTHSIVSLSFTPNGEVYAADSSGQIKLWSTKSTTPIHTLPSPSDDSKQLSCMTLSPISAVVAAGYVDGSVRIWDAASGSVADTLLRTQLCHTNKVSAISCSPKNARLVSTVGMDGKLVLIDTGSRTASDVCAAAETGEVLTALTFHEDGIHSAVGTMEGNILLYDWRNIRHPVINLPAHSPNAVNALAYQTFKMKDSSHGNTSSTSSRAAEAPSQASAVSQVTSKTNPPALSSPPLPPSELPSLKEAHSMPLPNPATRSNPSDDLRPISPGAHNEALRSTPLPPVPASVALPAHSSSRSNYHNVITIPDTKVAHPSELLDNSFSSSYSHRLQTHVQVGRHVASQPPPQGSGSAHVDFSTREIVQEMKDSLPDFPYIQAKLHSEVDKALNRSFVSTTSQGMGAGGGVGDFEELRQAVKPVTSKDLEEALEFLRYDIHNEVQEIMREQVRQFIIAKDDTANMIKELSSQLAELLQANKELREENERLRRIY